MATPTLPPMDQWYYASDLTRMLQVLRDQGKQVPPDADTRNNKARLEALSKHLNPFPTLDEARDRFGVEIRGRNVPETRAAFVALSAIPDGKSGDPIPSEAPGGDEKVPESKNLASPRNPVGSEVARGESKLRSGARASHGESKYVNNGMIRTVDDGSLLYGVTSPTGADLWVAPEDMPRFGLPYPEDPRPSARIRVANRPGAERRSSSDPRIVVMSIRDGVATIKFVNGALMAIPVVQAMREYPTQVQLYYDGKSAGGAKVLKMKVAEGRVLYLVSRGSTPAVWEPESRVPADALQGFLRNPQAASVDDAALVEQVSDSKKYDNMSFPYNVSGTNHSLFSKPNTFDPRVQWKLWWSKFRKAYHLEQPMVLASFAKVHIHQGSMSVKPPKFVNGLRTEMSAKDIAWSKIEGVEDTAQLPPVIFWNLLHRRNLMDMHCYYNWRADIVQDVLCFESALHDLNCKIGFSKLVRVYDLVMMRRAEVGVHTKYAEILDYVRGSNADLFFPPHWYDSTKPEWILQTKKDSGNKDPKKNPADEKKLVNCEYWLKGNCRYKKRCRNYHDPGLKGVKKPRNGGGNAGQAAE